MKGRKFYVDLMQDSTEVTGTFTLCVCKIEDKTIKFAVDCGIFQEKERSAQNRTFPVNPEDVEFVIITHNHVDHTGRLPYFVREGFHGRILTTTVTSAIIENALYDNAKVLSDNCFRKGERPLYDKDDVKQTLPLVEGFDYNFPIRVNDNITVTFVPNGHLIGAACVLVQVHCAGEPKDINLFFTGDYNNKNLFFRVPPVRKWITDLPLTIITECTYGDMDTSDIQRVFRKNIIKALKERKSIIILVFSLGRGQEILYILKEMQKKYPKLFKDVPIYYDGKLSFRYTNKYLELIKNGQLHFYSHKKDFLPEGLIYVKSHTPIKEVKEEEDEMVAIRENVVNDNNCKIVVTTSGMGSYGPAQEYLPKYICRSNALIHFTGYCAKGTLGRELKDTPKGEAAKVGATVERKRADVEYTNEFSAHAKADELIKFLNSFKHPLFILVNHGDDETKDVFAERVLKEVDDVENVAILGREYFYRVDANGFVKGVPTKFL